MLMNARDQRERRWRQRSKPRFFTDDYLMELELRHGKLDASFDYAPAFVVDG
jgi:hypothetical protein